MSGGGKPKSGLMSAKIVDEFTENQIQEAENDVRRKQEDLNNFKREIYDLSN